MVKTKRVLENVEKSYLNWNSPPPSVVAIGFYDRRVIAAFICAAAAAICCSRDVNEEEEEEDAAEGFFLTPFGVPAATPPLLNGSPAGRKI